MITYVKTQINFQCLFPKTPKICCLFEDLEPGGMKGFIIRVLKALDLYKTTDFKACRLLCLLKTAPLSVSHFLTQVSKLLWPD